MSLRTFRSLQRIAAAIAVTVLVAQPQLLLAEDLPGGEQTPKRIAPRSIIFDVALQDGGVLNGQVVDQQGRTLAATDVLLTDGRNHWRTKTDQHGRFQLAGLGGTTYHAKVGQYIQPIRAWVPGTAPPRSTPSVMLVHSKDVVLGQNCGSPVCGSYVRGGARHPLANPFILGGLVAAAVAIPIAIHNSDDDDDSPATN
jgi:hypothetical protein